jgi:hypothetical protein
MKFETKKQAEYFRKMHTAEFRKLLKVVRCEVKSGNLETWDEVRIVWTVVMK